MKQKVVCVLAVLICCSLFASPNRKSETGTPCPYAKVQKTMVVSPMDKSTADVADDLEILPMHQLVNSLL